MNAFGIDPVFGSPHNVWASPAQPNPFGPPPPPGFGPVGLSAPWGIPQAPVATFGMQGPLGRPSEPRTVAVRKMICRAYEELSSDANSISKASASDAGGDGGDDFIFLDAIKAKVEQLNQGNPVPEKELLDICDTEGNDGNGGGSFDVRQEDESKGGQVSIRFVSGNGSNGGGNGNGGGRSGSQPFLHRFGAPGEIGSPLVGGVGVVGSFAGGGGSR